MILTTHQPIFLPWPGFFHKAMHADCMVLLDDVQFPRGRSWINRNRLKDEDGELWLTVPVWKRGRGLQAIRRVEICNEKNWRQKHRRSLRQNYARAPYATDYLDAVERIYRQNHATLVDVNIDFIEFFWEALSIKAKLLRQSDMGVTGTGTDLLIAICRQAGAGRLLTFPMVEKHLDAAKMKRGGIELMHDSFRPPVYPQLWGEFIYNLSTLDMLLNCGPKSGAIIAGA
jgi:hypothetical protein